MTKTKEDRLRLESRRTGKGAAHQLRRQGKVPAVVYGHAMDPVPVALDARLLAAKTSLHKGPLLSVTMPDGEAARVLVRELRRDPLTGRLEHVDFQRVTAGETVRSEIALSLDEEALLLKAGLVPSWVQDHVLVEGAPESLPERLHIAAGLLAFGDQVTAGDLPLPEGVRLLTDAETIVLTVTAPKAEAPREGREEGEAPEAEPDAGQ